MKTGIFTTGKLSLLLLPAVIFLIAPGCSTSSKGTSSKYDVNRRADQTFSFNKEENGKNVRWDVNFEDGEISSIYKNGLRLPADEIKEYEDMIYHRIDKLQSKSHHITVDLSGFKSDMSSFKEDMKKLKEEMKNNHIEINFDNQEFKEEMKELSKELSRLKDKRIRIDFDSQKFRDEMEELKKDIKIHVDIDMDDLKENLDKMSDEMDKHRDELSHINIDLSGLDEAMSHLDDNLASVKINLNGLDLKLEKLNEFLDNLKEEMVNDKLIENKDDDVNLDLSKNSMKVNGKEVSPELFEKYKKMYEDYFDKDLSTEGHFRIIN